MKSLKKMLWLFLGLMVAFFLFLIWYQYKYAMYVVEPYEVNSPSLEKRLLIATQGSDFKDMVTTGVVDYYRADSIFIKVVDVTDLAEVDPDNFTAIVAIHNWEMWKPPVEVQTFMERTKKHAGKIIVLTTSGNGSYRMDGVDAITGESKLKNASLFMERIIERLNPLLNGKDLENGT
ncbi:MAG TPA: hypothetical protein VFD35_03125 [Pricia sp.]|nr:hypothetical protein [Pricia sp.]